MIRTRCAKPTYYSTTNKRVACGAVSLYRPAFQSMQRSDRAYPRILGFFSPTSKPYKDLNHFIYLDSINSVNERKGETAKRASAKPGTTHKLASARRCAHPGPRTHEPTRTKDPRISLMGCKPISPGGRNGSKRTPGRQGGGPDS
jgi:hypothetical protein